MRICDFMRFEVAKNTKLRGVNKTNMILDGNVHIYEFHKIV